MFGKTYIELLLPGGKMKRIMLIGLAVLIAGCGQQDEAKRRFQGVKEDRNYIQEGFKYLADADIQRAIYSFDQAIKNDPTNVDNFLILGQVYLRLKQPARAVDTFTAATRVDPNNGEARYLLATSQALNEELDEAIESAKLSVELFMQNRDEENFKRAVVLLRGLTQAQESGSQVSMDEAAEGMNVFFHQEDSK